jgi:hypothetical protein
MRAQCCGALLPSANCPPHIEVAALLTSARHGRLRGINRDADR